MKTDLEVADVLGRVNELLVGAVASSWCGRRAGLDEFVLQGKRLRPAVAIDWALCGRPVDAERLAHGAAAIELVHLTTLVHDDIIDESPHRRGVRSTWFSHGRGRAIVAGDALFGLAFGLAAKAGPDFVGVLTRAVEDVCAGQLQELDDIGRLDRSAEQVERIAALKTGSLFAVAAALGVMSSASDFTVDAAWDWGLSLGVGYQLVNDLKDVDVAGGGTGHDLQAGLLTEPWLYAGGSVELRKLLDQARTAPTGADTLEWLWRTPGPRLASERISQVLDRVEQLKPCPSFDQKTGVIARFRQAAAAIVEANCLVPGKPAGS
jgi:geranylgeranyl pyrophosphate synthase